MDYRALITTTAQSYGVPPAIALAVAQRESNIQQFDSSGRVIQRYEPKLGESSYGIFQLLASTAAQLGVNPSDPSQNISGGVRYLAQLYNLTGGNWQAALESYNGGIGNWQRGTVSDDAKRYAVAVLAAAGMSPSPTSPVRYTPTYTAGGGAYPSGTVVIPAPPTIPGTVSAADYGLLSNLFPTLPSVTGGGSGGGDVLLSGGSTDALDGVAVIGMAAIVLLAFALS